MILKDTDKKQVLLEPTSIGKEMEGKEFVTVKIGDDLEATKGVINSIGSSDADTRALRKIEDAKEKIRSLLRLIVIKNLLIEKILDTVVVFLLICGVVSWWEFYMLIKDHLWQSILAIALGSVVIYLMRCIPFLAKWPGCILLKAAYLLHRTAAFLQFGHLHGVLYWYASVISAATEVSIFMLYVTCGQKVETRSQVFWFYRLAMPLVVVVISQPLYFTDCGGQDMDYTMYMMAIGTVVLIALLLSYQPVLLLELYLERAKNKKVVQADEICPQSVAAFHQQSDMDLLTCDICETAKAAQ